MKSRANKAFHSPLFCYVAVVFEHIQQHRDLGKAVPFSQKVK